MELGLITPTQFIRRAALNSGVIPLSMGKSVEYTDADLVPVEDTKCYLCGGDTGGMGRPVAKAILPTFTDRDKARQPQSKSVCPGCTFCLTQREMRNYSMVVTTGKVIHPDRPTLRQLLLEPPEPPFVFCVATSGQLHLHFKSAINYDCDNYVVQMEQVKVTVRREIFADMLTNIEILYSTFSKEEITTGRYNQKRIKNFGLEKFQELESCIAGYRGQRLFDVAVFVAQKPPEKEEEQPCITISTPTTTKPQLALF